MLFQCFSYVTHSNSFPSKIVWAVAVMILVNWQLCQNNLISAWIVLALLLEDHFSERHLSKHLLNNYTYKHFTHKDPHKYYCWTFQALGTELIHHCKCQNSLLRKVRKLWAKFGESQSSRSSRNIFAMILSRACIHN